MASLFIGVVLIITMYSSEAAQDFKSVSVCPRDAASWKMSSDNKKCQGDTPDYLCAAIENEPDVLGEICTKHGLTPAKKCAVLNQQTKNLDSVDCKAPSGCPENPYSPSELWKHPICFKDFYGTTTTAPVTMATTTTDNKNSPSPDTGGSGAGAAVAVIVVLLIGIVVILVVFYRRNQFGFRDRMQPHVQVVLGLIERQRTPGQGSATTDVENTDIKEIEEKKALLHVEDGNAENQENAEYAIIKKPKKKEKPVDASVSKKSANKESFKGKGVEANQAIKLDEDNQKISKLKELLKYPVHILKHEVDVKDLKEKIVIYSKSIKEHFAPPQKSELQGVQNIDDYNRLDRNVIFSLIHNFCGNVKPPSKGWGYEPPSEETTIGADIERIRMMWNKFCDDDLDFPQLDDVYNRMRQKYGTVALHGDDSLKEFAIREEEGFEELKDKIQVIRLNPDCSVENGIVITDSITSATKILQEKNAVILKGAIGCGKTCALKAIQSHFETNGWSTAWIGESDLSTYSEKTILLCDNLFGRFGCHTFSNFDIQRIEKMFESIANDPSDSIKVAIGIHQHVFEEVKKTFSLKFLQNKNLSIDMDKLTDAETLMIFKEQQKEGHCKADSGCWFGKIEFSSVLSKLHKSPGQIGSPFLSLMFCYFHDLFSEEDFTKNPVQSLVKRLNTMRKDSLKDYSCLVYLMCVQNQDLDKDLETWAGHIGAEITINAIDNLNKQKPGYIHIEQKKATLIHDVLAIALFKSAAEAKEDFLPVVQYCREDILLELMRPSGDDHCEFYTSLVNARKNEDFRDVGKNLVFRLARSGGKDLIHPLRSEEIFRDKYVRYLKSEPKKSAGKE